MNLAASTASAALGSIGLGGLALILAVWLWLGTRRKAKAPLGDNAALTLGLVAGVVWMSASRIWGVPDDLIKQALGSVQKTQGFGDIGYGAISIVLVIVAYCLKLKPRAMGYMGIVMASTFALTGGIWALLTGTVGDMAIGFAS